MKNIFKKEKKESKPKQIIISIGRQYGSAGREIGVKLAEKLSIPLYDRNLFDEIGKAKHIDTNNLEKFDEVPRKIFFSRRIKGYSSSLEENLAELQFNFLKAKADQGESFVVVGRCADELFRGRQGFVSIFIVADEEEKIKRIMQIRNFDRKKAIAAIKKHDKKRQMYHDYFCEKGKWGQCTSYDLCVNSSRLGIDSTIDFIYDYIQKALNY